MKTYKQFRLDEIAASVGANIEVRGNPGGIYTATVVGTVLTLNMAAYPKLAKATGRSGHEALTNLAKNWSNAGFLE